MAKKDKISPNNFYPSTFLKRSLNYSPETLSLLKQQIISIKKEEPIVISITGGSGVGKSTLTSYIQNILGDNATILAQDDFQLGEDFEAKETSPYRWDDPRNFDIPGYELALKTLLKGQETSVPVFSLKENKRTGTKTLKPNSYIICEGLYTLNENLLPYIDLSIYMESSFYARFLRRIFRFTEESKINLPDVPVKHMLLPVHLAHIDFVTLQKKHAHIVITVPYSFEETRNKFNLQGKKLQTPSGTKLYSYISEEGIAIESILDQQKNYWLITKDHGQTLFKAQITKDLLKNLKKINFNET